MRLLFVKHSLVFPRVSGHDVHTFHMMKACAELGATVDLATVTPVEEDAIEGSGVSSQSVIGGGSSNGHATTPLHYSKLQERFRSYWGVERTAVGALAALVVQHQPDALVAVGLDALAYFPAANKRTVRVWYAADEWVWHHLTLLRAHRPDTWPHLRAAAVKGVYERAFAPITDRAWVVSREERQAMRWFAGIPQVDIVPNGVDADHYAPTRERANPDSSIPSSPIPNSAVFWGRLDFEPNIQALTWFCERVWPALRAKVSDARLTIIGFNPLAQVRALAATPGVELKSNLPDLRAEVQRHAVAVLPFISGGGIKNKLLEAAALGMPIVCSPRATTGLESPPDAALHVARTPDDWVRHLTALWADTGRQAASGDAARTWVTERHSWRQAAETALRGIERSRVEKGRS